MEEDVREANRNRKRDKLRRTKMVMDGAGIRNIAQSLASKRALSDKRGHSVNTPKTSSSWDIE